MHDGPFDVFLSYRQLEGSKELACKIQTALERVGLKVFRDETEIEPFDGISEGVARGLANSKILLAVYTKEYPVSKSCQWELIHAYIAAAKKHEVHKRILILKPESGGGKIDFADIKDAVYLTLTESMLETLADKVKTLAGQTADTFQDIAIDTSVNWYPYRRSPAGNFVGRIQDMWRLHGKLDAHLYPMTSKVAGTPIVQIIGLGGIGKSLFVSSYAQRFDVAFPGGVFWLNASHANQDLRNAKSDQIATLKNQLDDFAAMLGTNTKSCSLPETRSILGKILSDQQKPYVWIIDDFHYGVNSEDICTWYAPEEKFGRTVFTTRSRAHEKIGSILPFDVLDPDDAYDLLCSHRKPQGDKETSAAHGIVNELGGHALALDLTAARLRMAGGDNVFQRCLEQIQRSPIENLETYANLVDELPTKHEKSIITTFRSSIDSLDEESKIILAIASLLGSAPIPCGVFQDIIAIYYNLNEVEAETKTLRALRGAERLSLTTHIDVHKGLWSTHTLVCALAREILLADYPRESLRAIALKVLNTKLNTEYTKETYQQIGLFLFHICHLIVDSEGLETASVSMQLINVVSNFANVSGTIEKLPQEQEFEEKVFEMFRKITGTDNLTV